MQLQVYGPSVCVCSYLSKNPLSLSYCKDHNSRPRDLVTAKTKPKLKKVMPATFIKIKFSLHNAQNFIYFKRESLCDYSPEYNLLYMFLLSKICFKIAYSKKRHVQSKDNGRFPVGSMVRNLPADVRDTGSSLVQSPGAGNYWSLCAPRVHACSKETTTTRNPCTATRAAPPPANWRKSPCSKEDPAQPRIGKLIKLF